MAYRTRLSARPVSTAASSSSITIANTGDLPNNSTSGGGGSSSNANQNQSQASVVAIARAISPPTPAPSPQPTANAIRLAQAHAHARAMAAVADAAAAAAATGAGPSSALANSFTAMPSTPPHQEDAKLTPVIGSLSGIAAATDLISMDTDRDERTLHSLQSHFLHTFPSLTRSDRLAFLSALIPLSTARELTHLQSLITPNLKVDFLSALPYELSLHILSFIDEPVTLARCADLS